MIHKPVFCHVFQETTSRVTDGFGQLVAGFRLVLIAAKSICKSLVSVRLPTCISVALTGHFCEIWYWALLWTSVEKIQIGLKSERNIGHCCVSMATASVCIVLMATRTLTIQRDPLLRFHCDRLHEHPTQCCVIHALSVLLLSVFNLISEGLPK